MSVALLLAATTATTAGAAAVYVTRGLRRQITALRRDLTALHLPEPRSGGVPHARTAPVAEIRAAVADALAEERERELAEARAFWAAQEARDLAGPGVPGAPFGTGEELYLPRQGDFAGVDPLFGPEPEEDAELEAARRRHPSHPDFTPAGVVGDHERILERLMELAEAEVPLADVRPGPLGTLDVYVFADGTTICMTPGHRETAESLSEALRGGDAPVLLGGSGVVGAYALTFGCATGNIYVLADRVIASL
ncbi:hypothetical protein AB0L16_24480 [Streptomyces orinoci]|uniref:Secreted protein n=2 Tax=Streptomyces orinoci TaxID=67339 RepID=A0ABV3K3A6_STRON|nr:hypothetical protein [Streptomyces orinoci]